MKKNFDYWWSKQGAWVEEPNERRSGSSGVQFLPANLEHKVNLYSKRQVNHCYRSFSHPFARPTVFRERDAIEALGKLDIRVPNLVFCDAEKRGSKWHAILITEELTGFVSLESWLSTDTAKNEQLKKAVLVKVASMLAKMHKHGYQHSCCYAKHIFIKAENGHEQSVEVALLDLEKLRFRWPARYSALHDMSQLYRHKASLSDAGWNFLIDSYCAANSPLTATDCEKLKRND